MDHGKKIIIIKHSWQQGMCTAFTWVCPASRMSGIIVRQRSKGLKVKGRRKKGKKPERKQNGLEVEWSGEVARVLVGGGGGNVFGPILAVNTPKLCLSAADDTSLDKL
ncbi:unnamed protein product [Arctogadus glacialis]